MSKHGQHHNDAVNPRQPRGHETSRGNNNPSKSVTITTGTYKKPETAEAQAREHRDADRTPQAADNRWNDDVRDEPTNEGSTRYRGQTEGHRSGSDSNESSGTRGH